jgi:hypothetical protein
VLVALSFKDSKQVQEAKSKLETNKRVQKANLMAQQRAKNLALVGTIAGFVHEIAGL